MALAKDFHLPREGDKRASWHFSTSEKPNSRKLSVVLISERAQNLG